MPQVPDALEANGYAVFGRPEKIPNRFDWGQFRRIIMRN